MGFFPTQLDFSRPWHGEGFSLGHRKFCLLAVSIAVVAAVNNTFL